MVIDIWGVNTTAREKERMPPESRKYSWSRPEEKDSRLGKRLAYLLRYGAEKEGLQVHEGGYVELMELMRVPLLRFHQPHEVLEEVENSRSFRHTRRFEKKNENSTIYIRAIHGRRMERNPLHEGSEVPRLFEKCLDYVCDNLSEYDLSNFPDDYLVNTVIHKLRHRKKLTNKALQSLLGPGMDHLHLDRMYVTEGTIRLVSQRCPHLKVLSLRDCGYVMTDHFMEILLKKLRELESLNISSCSHLTDRTLQAIAKNLPNLIKLNGTSVPQFTETGVLHMVQSCQKLQHLDIYSNRNFSQGGRDQLAEIARARGMMVVLRGMEEEGITPENPSDGFGKLWW